MNKKHKTLNISEVGKDEGLCCGCGTCAGVCPEGIIDMHLNADRGFFGAYVNEELCAHCGICLKCCPGYELDFEALTPSSWKNNSFHPLIGYFSNIYIGHANDYKLCFNGASGGMITAFVIHLLRKRLIDGVIVTKMRADDPLQTETFIAKNEEEIISAQKSKYCPVPLGTIIRRLKTSKGRYGLVGLPCHISGFRKAQQYFPWLRDRISFYLGLFCSRTPSLNATLHLLKRKGIRKEELEHLDYRGDGHPGYMKLAVKDGREIKIPHLDYNYWGHIFYKFFIPPRCYLCIDKTAYFADISFGDNWSPLMKRSCGSSSIIVRNSSILSLLREMQGESLISLNAIEGDFLAQNQDLYNKCNIAPRMRLWKFIGGNTPAYRNKGIFTETSSLSNLIAAIPHFIRVLATRKARNFTIMNAIAKLFWYGDKITQSLLAAGKIGIRIFIGLKMLFLALLPVKQPLKRKTKKFKIVLMGGYGGQDIGDEAMPHADLINLRSLFGNDLDIVMLSPNPEYTIMFHREKSIKDLLELGHVHGNSIINKLLNIRASALSLLFIIGAYAEKFGISIRLWDNGRNVLDELKYCDLIFNVGGGNLNSLIPQEFYKKGIIYLVAAILKKPVIVSGQTVGPFMGKFDRIFARFCLDKVHMITFRDKEISHKRLQDIGVQKPIMIDAADDAMTIPSITAEAAMEILLTEAGREWYDLKSDLLIALNLKGSAKLFKKKGELSDLSKECRFMADLADELAGKYHAKCILIPTDYCPEVDDRETHLDVIKRVKNKSSVRAVNGEYDDVSLKGLIGLCDAAIGSRYHFCVFAASQYIPFLGIASGIYQKTKLKGLADLCDLQSCFVEEEMDRATVREVLPKIEWLIENKDDIHKRLKAVVPSLQEKSAFAVKEAFRILLQGSK
jgi:coenzyme F420 hydrogenase subunit beta